jgi:CRP-like cAMP-binding protein
MALSRRLRRADEQIGGLVLLDVHGRIARLILDSAGPDGVLDKKLTHQTIAHMIGASRETVSRAMRDFQDRALITVQRRQIAIADRSGLEAVAHKRA